MKQLLLYTYLCLIMFGSVDAMYSSSESYDSSEGPIKPLSAEARKNLDVVPKAVKKFEDYVFMYSLRMAPEKEQHMFAELQGLSDEELNQTSKFGKTILHELGRLYDNELLTKVLTLLQEKDLSAILCKKYQDRTPLMASIERLANLSLAKFILSHKGVAQCINAQNADGETALHMLLYKAVPSNLPQVLVLLDKLLKLNPSLSIKDNNGRTPVASAHHLVETAVMPSLFKARRKVLEKLETYQAGLKG